MKLRVIINKLDGEYTVDFYDSSNGEYRGYTSSLNYPTVSLANNGQFRIAENRGDLVPAKWVVYADEVSDLVNASSMVCQECDSCG